MANVRYNTARQLTSVTAPTTGSVSYTYDGASRRTAVGYPSGHKASYAYSNLGQLATVTDWTGRPTTFSYDIAGRLTTITRTNSVGGAITNSAFTYDNANRVTRIQHKRGATTLEDIQYTLNAAGLRTQMVDSIGTTTWAYDELNRLSSASYPNNDAVVYGFDAVGNRTSMAENSVVTNYTYDLADRLTQSVKSGVTTSYTWDQNGNRLTKSVGGVTTTYGWDALDRMTSHAAGGVTTSYTYNGDSRRVSKSVGGSTTNFAWDVAGMGYILAESGASANEFVWGGGLIAQLTTSGGTPTYAHADGLGSLRLLTDVAGNVAGSRQYDAYGASRGSSGTTLSFGFTGEYQDSESGLFYLRARYYDPTTGRFVSQDPVPSEPRYAYAQNNPIMLSDPTGTCTDIIGCATYLHNPVSFLIHVGCVNATCVEQRTGVAALALPIIAVGLLAWEVAPIILSLLQAYQTGGGFIFGLLGATGVAVFGYQGMAIAIKTIKDVIVTIAESQWYSTCIGGFGGGCGDGQPFPDIVDWRDEPGKRPTNDDYTITYVSTDATAPGNCSACFGTIGQMQPPRLPSYYIPGNLAPVSFGEFLDFLRKDGGLNHGD